MFGSYAIRSRRTSVAACQPRGGPRIPALYRGGVHAQSQHRLFRSRAVACQSIGPSTSLVPEDLLISLRHSQTAKLTEEEKNAFLKFATGAKIHLDEGLLEEDGVARTRIYRNSSPGQLYEHAVTNEPGTAIASNGALCAYSGAKMGRSPLDKRVVEEAASKGDVWWGPVNRPMSAAAFMTNRERAIDYLNTKDRLYVVDAFAGADPAYRIKVRVVTSRAYHALFMWNMLIRPTEEELINFGLPDYTIYNAGEFPCNRFTEGMTSGTSVALSFERGEMVILGTQYAGEMKKGVFTICNYLMPKQGVLSMHASANEGKDGDVSIFFGLSGTGKTTLSSDPKRKLIGDDEHCWSDTGVFNIEGGCYAKAIGLNATNEPEIYASARYGAVLENVCYDRFSRDVDFNDTSLTENTRLSYPLDYVPNAKLPSMGGHPKNIIMLTCDAFGVLPPVSRLTPEQAMYHFMSGYTAKVAGTEEGVTEPEATFSACFGAPFLVWHPSKYAELLAAKMKQHQTHCWLVNTGWSGGAYGEGKRLTLRYTRNIIDAIHSGELTDSEYETMPIFNLSVPRAVTGVPSDILMPKKTWADPAAFDQTVKKLAGLFQESFTAYEEGSAPEIKAAGPSFD